MLFNSYIFLAFLPITWAVYFLFNHFNKFRIAQVTLIVASFVFYGYGNYRLCLLLAFSITVNYLLHLGMMRERSSDGFRRFFLILGILINLGLLFYYVYNRDVIARGWERVLDAVWGVPDNIDSAYTWEDSELFGREITLNTAVDTRAQLLQNRTEGEDENRDEKIVTCQENLDNILPFIEENPDTEFIVFLPPYSMLYWEQLVLKGELEDMLEVYRYAMKQLLQYDNVSVYYFQNEKNIITNLDNYRDTCHHRPEYNRYIFEAVRDGKNRVTEENLGQIIEDMYEFAVDFDYNSYWE